MTPFSLRSTAILALVSIYLPSKAEKEWSGDASDRAQKFAKQSMAWLKLGWFRPSLKGKLDSLEIQNAVIGTEISRGTFGPIVEVTVQGGVHVKKYTGQRLNEELVSKISQRTLFDNFPFECARISCLDHVNVVKLHGVDTKNSSFLPILVTEQLGSPLSDYLLKAHAEPTSQMSILRDIARGLQYLHCLPNPVLHLCLTPDNIVINPDTLQVRIFNAGIVNLMQLPPSWCRSNLPRADSFLPEMEDTKPDPSIDIFSYGAMMIYVFLPRPEPICPPVFVQHPNDSSNIAIVTNKEMGPGKYF